MCPIIHLEGFNYVGNLGDHYRSFNHHLFQRKYKTYLWTHGKQDVTVEYTHTHTHRSSGSVLFNIFSPVPDKTCRNSQRHQVTDSRIKTRVAKWKTSRAEELEGFERKPSPWPWWPLASFLNSLSLSFLICKSIPQPFRSHRVFVYKLNLVLCFEQTADAIVTSLCAQLGALHTAGDMGTGLHSWSC